MGLHVVPLPQRITLTYLKNATEILIVRKAIIVLLFYFGKPCPVCEAKSQHALLDECDTFSPELLSWVMGHTQSLVTLSSF